MKRISNLFLAVILCSICLCACGKTASHNEADEPVTGDTKRVLENFVNGKNDAYCYLEENSEHSDETYVLKSYDELYEDVTAGEEHWGETEYIDFDNDGEEELILHGYTGACLFFDVVDEDVYLRLKTGGTADVAYVTERDGKNVIVRADVTHAGRKSYVIMEYDADNLLECARLYVEYKGAEYTSEDVFYYRDEKVSMEQFEEILNSIQVNH